MKNTCLVLTGLFLSFNAFALAEGMKPGLWQTTSTMKSKSGKMESQFEAMQKQMKSMPAAQRKMMEEAMAKRGMNINGKNVIAKICVTKEQAESLEIPKNDNCDQEIITRTKTSIKMKFTCKNNTKGTGEFNLEGPAKYNMSSIIQSTVNGTADEMNIKQDGKWLSADCGSIKPFKNNDTSL